ncbi:hypothetical protein A3R75_003022 [Salmonella enterica subsp. diarizonae]|nr:hypothetical protein [Salmonella enterica subsp. diarizonae]
MQTESPVPPQGLTAMPQVVVQQPETTAWPLEVVHKLPEMPVLSLVVPGLMLTAMALLLLVVPELL